MCYMGFRSPMRRGNFEGGKEHPIVKYRDTLWSYVQKRLTDSDAVWVVGSDVPRNHVKWESRSPYGKGNFWGKGLPL